MLKNADEAPWLPLNSDLTPRLTAIQSSAGTRRKIVRACRCLNGRGPRLPLAVTPLDGERGDDPLLLPSD